ncbi:hypothetical protein [Agaribacter flavus]|uniref:Uncharacterized protein n=1 Tax=Agaribacter flavus TaxID=1902781 RepID=A0ABV7FMJ8_9ALTE
MKNLGFHTEPLFSIGQLVVLLVVISACLAILIILKKKRDSFQSWFPLTKKKESVAFVEKQNIDRNMELYRIFTTDHSYLIVKSSDNLLVLDKTEQQNK